MKAALAAALDAAREEREKCRYGCQVGKIAFPIATAVSELLTHGKKARLARKKRKIEEDTWRSAEEFATKFRNQRHLEAEEYRQKQVEYIESGDALKNYEVLVKEGIIDYDESARLELIPKGNTQEHKKNAKTVHNGHAHT